jgi:hypothetical protein
MAELIDEAVRELYSRLETGSDCPCCGQKVKAYKRMLRANHVRFLVDLVRKTTREEPWIHYRECFFQGRDYNYLSHFGLAEFRERGLWRATTRGQIFVLGQTTVPAWIEVYNNSVIREASQHVSVRECLQAGDFDYDALMGERGQP